MYDRIEPTDQLIVADVLYEVVEFVNGTWSNCMPGVFFDDPEIAEQYLEAYLRLVKLAPSGAERVGIRAFSSQAEQIIYETAIQGVQDV